jgi:hypothetical protein
MSENKSAENLDQLKNMTTKRSKQPSSGNGDTEDAKEEMV